jgi:hypothetical protein
VTAYRTITAHDELDDCGVVPHSELDNLAKSMLVVVSGSFGDARTLVEGPGIRILDNGPGKELIVSAIFQQSWLEIPIGIADGQNKIFLLQHSPVPALALMFFINGILQQQGDDSDYILDENHVILNHTYRSGSSLFATYPF